MPGAEWLGRVALAVLFASSAVMKGRSIEAFEGRLRIPFRDYAKPLARVVVVVEGALSLGLLFPSNTIPVAAILFLSVASLYLALRLILSDSAECGCWGSSDSVASPTPRESILNILRPIWYSLRNGGLLFILVALVTGQPATLVAAWMLPFVSTTLGLLISVIIRHRHLRLDPHPRVKVLGPRLAPLMALSWHTGTSTGGWLVVFPHTRRGSDLHRNLYTVLPEHKHCCC